MLENIVNICPGLNGILYTHLKIPFYIPLTLTILYFSVSFENNKNKTEYCISGVCEKLNTQRRKSNSSYAGLESENCTDTDQVAKFATEEKLGEIH